MTWSRTTALVVVDVQNDFADPEGGLYVHGGEQVVPVVNDAVAGETVLPDADEPVEEIDEDDAVAGADAKPTADVLGVDGEAEPVLADNELAGQDIDLDDTPPS